MERKFQGDRRIEDGGLCILFWLPSSLKLRRDKTPPKILKRLLTQTISIWITKAGFVVKINFYSGMAISGQLEHISPPCPGLDFF
jgi:hypothetical protein